VTEELELLIPAVRYTLKSLIEYHRILRTVYDRNTKWIPEGMFMHRSILPQITN
jgi:hypothetical protein